MEQNTAWGLINSGGVMDTTLYDLVIPVMQCRSSGISPGESRISYVANAGPLNDRHVGTIYAREFGHLDRPRRDAKMYTIFFDHHSHIGAWRDVPLSYADYSAAGLWLENMKYR